MKKLTALLAVLALVAAMLLSGCETVFDEYESDTFELGSSSTGTVLD